MKFIIILVTIAIIHVNAEPPVGKDHQNHQNQIDGYQSGPPPQGWNQLSNYGPPPQDSYQHKQPTKIRNTGNSNIFGWLGSRFAKIPSLLPRLPSFPKFTFNQHQKPQYQALVQNGDYGNKPEKVKIYNQPTEQNYGQQHQQQYSAPQQHQQQQYSAPAGPQLEVFPSTMIAYSQMSQSGPSQSSYIQPSYAAPTLAPASLKPAKIPNGPVPYVPVSTGPDYFDTAYYQQQMREQQKLQQQYSSPAHIYQQPQQQSYHVKQTYQRPQPQHQQSHYQKPQIQSYQAPQQSYQQPQQQYQNPIVNLAEYSNNYDAPLTAFSTIPDIGTQEISNNYADYTNQNIQSHSFGQNQIHQQSHSIPQPGDSYSAPSAPEANIKAQGSNSYSTHLSPGVKLLSQSSQEGTGNPVFEIITDADAPSFNGHPFDLKKLLAMIEPGAEIESLPQLSELASESKSTYTQVVAPPGISGQKDKSSAPHNSSARPELTSTSTTTQNPNHNYEYLSPYMYSPPSTSSPVQNTKSSSSSEINPYLDEILELVDDDEYSDKPSLILESQGDLSAAESQENGELQGSESQVHSYRIKITPPPNFFTTSKPTVKYFNPKSPKPMVSPPSLVRNNKSIKNPAGEIVKVDLETLKNTNITTSSAESNASSSSTSSSSTTKRPSPVFKGKTVDSH